MIASEIHLRNTSYWECLKTKVIQNKRLITSTILTAALCFGFTICNYSIGVDDPARNHYLYSTLAGSMVQQGRLMHVLVNYLTGFVDFIPFFNDFLGATLFAISALLFCGLFQYVTDGKLSDLGCIAFCCIYISYSITNEKFIYQLDVVVTMLSYCLTALGLVYAYKYTLERNLTLFVKAVCAMVFALGSYETFVFLFFCGVFAIFLLEIVFNSKNMTVKELLFTGLIYAVILIAALILYYGTVLAAQILTDQYGVFHRANAWRGNGHNLVETFITVTKTICKMLINFQYLPILEFVIVSVVGFILFPVLSIRRKNLGLLLCWLALFGGNFFIHYINGSIMYRGAQTFCFFVAFVILLLIEQLRTVPLTRGLLIAFVIYLTLVQAADMNRWFWNDYLRYKKDSFAIHSIATDLVSDCDVSKPVVFTNGWYTYINGGYLHTHYIEGGQANGNSALYWAGGTLYRDIEVLHLLFRMEGYDFIIMPTQEQINSASTESLGMPSYPNAGYIRETENYIIVNLGTLSN